MRSPELGWQDGSVTLCPGERIETFWKNALALVARRDRDAASPPGLEAAMSGGGRRVWLTRVRAAVTEPGSLRS